jgi:peptidoglycan/LPS O-acetylase OafA/YrhL
VKTRNQQIDVLRGLAILLVLGRHNGYYELWHRVGWIGVDLFFVLSGFLISGLLFSEYKATGAISFSRFFIRRGFKIYPAYYFFLLLLLPFTFHHITLADATFTQSYLPAFWGHGWSLAIEEHFYIALPLLLILCIRLAPKTSFSWIPLAMPIVAGCCLLMRIRVGSEHFLNSTHLRFDALFAGVTLGWFWHFRRQSFSIARQNWLAVIGLALASGAFYSPEFSFWMYTVGLSANLLGFSCLLVWALNTPTLGKLMPLSAIGFYSYSIYLWHWPIAQMFESLVPSNVVTFWLYVGTCIGVGTMMARLIEGPSLKIRDRYFPPMKWPTSDDACETQADAWGRIQARRMPTKFHLPHSTRS